MSGGSGKATDYNTIGEANGGTADNTMTKQFIDQDFVVNKKPTQLEVQMYKDAISKSQFENDIWMDIAVTKFWIGSSKGYKTCHDVARFCRFPFLCLIAMSLMVYFPALLIKHNWPSSIECMEQRHGWTVILASEAVIIYLFSRIGIYQWIPGDDNEKSHNVGSWFLYLMLSSYSTRHKWVVILGHFTNVVCRGFLITGTAFALVYADPQLEEILIKGVEMLFLMEVPNVLGFMSKERIVGVLVNTYEQKGIRVVNYDTWQRQNKWLVRINNLIESAALVWSILLPLTILFCM